MGEYHHNVDTKGRLIVPAKFRDNLGESFVLTRGLDQCLFGYPLDEWKIIEEKLKNLPLTKKDARAFTRFFFSGATECEIDFCIILSDINGKIEIGIAECKDQGGEINQDDIEHFKLIRNKFEKVYLKCYFIFSKTAEFTPTEINIFKDLEKDNIDCILFTDKELEPFDPYEEYKDKITKEDILHSNVKHIITEAIGIKKIPKITVKIVATTSMIKMYFVLLAPLRIIL